MVLELINPSDPYTFIADDEKTAALAVLCISSAYGAQNEDGDVIVPIAIFNPDWFEEKFGETAENALMREKHATALALQSFVYGGFSDRRKYEAAMEAINDECKRQEFSQKWHMEITSLNNIREKALKLANALDTTADAEEMTENLENG